MTDLFLMQRMAEVLKAIEKMHNGLLALIDEHDKLVQRVRDLEDQVNTQQGN